MKVTVFIPAYNVENYIAAAIDSVLSQTFRDWELVIVDDCSTDGTYGICARYAANDRRIRLFRNEENLGMMANWVNGIQYCQGTYWGKLDADDTWAPDMLSACVNILDQQSEVGMVVTRYVNMDESGKVLDGSEYSLPPFARNTAISFVPFVLSGMDGIFKYQIAQQGVGLMRRKIFEELGNFTLLPAGDTEMWFRIGAHYKVYCLDALMHYHRIWSNNFTRTQVLGQNKLEQNLYDVRNAIFNYYANQGFIPARLASRFKKQNQFEFNKTCIASYLKQGNWAAAFRTGMWNLFFFPVKSVRFYTDRLLNRLR